MRGESHKAKNTHRGVKKIKENKKLFPSGCKQQAACEAAWRANAAGGAACWDVEQLSCDSWREPQDVSGNQHLDKKGINNPRKGAGLFPSAVSPGDVRSGEPLRGAPEVGQPHSLKLPLHRHLLQVRIWPLRSHARHFLTARMRTVDQ